MADVTFTVDGKKLTAPAGTLLIEACRKAGIEIPAFCYYPGLSLQAACRMCVVRQEKVPKLQTLEEGHDQKHGDTASEHKPYARVVSKISVAEHDQSRHPAQAKP